tara:strand:- start:35 stop:1339 length:1305 start_codon:yes stop_codon:yes gene_type:complete
MSMIDNPECQVLGSLLCDSSYIFQIQEALTAEDFISVRHRNIFKAILFLGEKSDVFTITEEVGGDSDDISYLSEMADCCVTPKNIMAYAQSLIEAGRKRKIRAIGQMIMESIESKEKSEVTLDALGEAINLIGTTDIRNTQTTLNDALKEVYDQLQDRINGKNEVYKTGFSELDEYMPFASESLYLLGGLSGMGKTSLLQSFLEAQVFNDVPCYFNSAEMPASAVARRFLQSAASIKSSFFNDPNKNIGDGQVGASLTAGLIKLKDRNLMIDDEQGLNIATLKVRARNWITSQKTYQKNGRAVLAVDYVQLLDYDHRNSSASLGKITKELRALAKELGIVVILLVQFNNDYKSRPDKRPIPSDIAGSNEMYKDCDGAIFCYRDIVFNPDTPDRDIMELIISKNRNGQLGNVRSSCELQYFRIKDIKTQFESQAH